MGKLSPLRAFALAILAALIWFVAVMLTLKGGTPSPLFHIIILLMPLLACGLIQFHFGRNTSQTPLRQLIQVGCAALLAPVLATSVIWIFWVVLLGHSE